MVSSEFRGYILGIIRTHEVGMPINQPAHRDDISGFEHGSFGNHAGVL